jgi:hypothetical protein
MGGVCCKHGRGEKSFAGKARGDRPLGSLRRRWEDGIRMGFREIS